MRTLALLFLTIFIWLLPTNLFAGKKELSSMLYQKQKEIENNDFSKGNDSIASIKYDEFKKLLDSFIVFYEPNKQYVISLNLYANHISRNSPSEGINLLQKAEQICEKHDFDTLKAFVTHDLASIYFHNDLINESYSLFVESAEYFKQINDIAAYGYALVDVGNIFYRKGQWDLATEYYLKSAKVFESAPKQSDKAWGLSLVYDNLGQVFAKASDFNSSIYYFNLSYKIRLDNKLESSYYNSFLTFADLYSDYEYQDSAYKYFQKAVDICIKQKQTPQLAFTYYVMGKYLLKIDSNDALKYYHKSYKLAKKVHSVNILRSLSGLTKYYYGNGKNIDSALYYALEFYEKAKLYNNDFYKSNSISYLGNIYRDLGNHEEEAKFLRMKLDKLKKDRDEELYKSELVNEGAKWNKERAELKESQRRNILIRNFQTAIVILVILFSFFLFRTQRKLRKTAKQLEASNINLKDTIRTKDVVYSIVAHDLRGPVGAQLELMKLIDNDDIDAESFLGVVPTIRKSMQSTYNLLENLLSWAQFNKHEVVIKKVSIKLFEIVFETEKIIEDIAKAKNINFINNVDSEIIVNADRNSISTVIRNLISNAIKFTNEGGSITIQSKDNKGFVEISVIDTGRGMDKKTLDSIFDKNKIVTTRGTADEKGSGLGLKLCWEFVHLNGGKIWVESEEGVGSSFSFTLPKENAKNV